MRLRWNHASSGAANPVRRRVGASGGADRAPMERCQTDDAPALLVDGSRERGRTAWRASLRVPHRGGHGEATSMDASR